MSGTTAAAAQRPYLTSVILLATLAGIGLGLAKVATALYAISLESSPLELGLIAGAQTAGLLVTSLPCGVLVERLGPVRLFCLGSLLAGGIYQLVPLVPQPLYLLALTLIVGLCMPCRLVSLNTVFMQQLAQMGEARAGWFRGSQMIGMLLIGPALAALLADWRGPAGSWSLVGVAFLVPILLAPLALRVDPAPRRQAEPLSLAAVGRQLTLLRRDAELRDNCLLDFTVQATAMFFSFFIVAITVQDFGWSAQQAAALLGGHGLAYIFALFFLGRLFGNRGQASFAISLLLCAAALLGLGLTRQPLLLWAAGLVLGAGLGTLQIGTLSSYARFGMRLGHGRIAGLSSLIGPAGSMSGCLLGGLLGEQLGLQHLFLLLVPPLLAFLLPPLLRGRCAFLSARRTAP